MAKTELYLTIQRILADNPHLRSGNDDLLEAEVCRKWNPNFDSMSAAEFIVLRTTLGYPSREYICKTKRLVQRENEQLRGERQ